MKPYAAHAEHTAFGYIGKRYRFKELGIWKENPEYYNPTNKGKYYFLRYKVL